MSDREIVAFQNVSFSYATHLAVENISFTIRAGEFVGLIGPNGSGKTTLVKLLLKLLTPQKGHIDVFGIPIQKFRDWHRIGYVPQKISQGEAHFPVSVEEVVLQGRVAKRGMLRRLKGEDYDAVGAALAAVGMQDATHTLVRELSGGQQQRVFIARALASKPDLLILDEPTVGVDAASQDEFYALLSTLQKQHHLTILMVSHDIEVMATQVSRLLCINKRIVYHGSPERFLKGDFVEELYGHDKRLIHHVH